MLCFPIVVFSISYSLVAYVCMYVCTYVVVVDRFCVYLVCFCFQFCSCACFSSEFFLSNQERREKLFSG